MAQGEIELGYWGLRRQPYADLGGPLVQYSINDPLICNSGSVGMNIADLTARFPYAVQMLQDAGFSNADIETRTYPWMVYHEATLRDTGGYSPGFPMPRTTIRIPAGYWYFNTEIRAGQNRNLGSSNGFNGGWGGTVANITATNWKSLHGAQNDHVRILFTSALYAGEDYATAQPLQMFGGDEYMHYFTVEQMRLNGTSALNSFWDPNLTEIGVMMHNAGERCTVQDCEVSHFRGIGVLVSGHTARPRVANCSMFYNQMAAVGLSSGALSEVIFEDLSCDNNPYVLFMFRHGSNVFGTGPILPRNNGGSSVPGGTITFRNIKTEAFACRSGYAGMTTCAPNMYGRGGMWAHLTGRFWFQADGCTLNVHSGKIWTAIEVSDQNVMNDNFPGQGWLGGIGLDNSNVHVSNAKFTNVQNWLADWRRQRVHPVSTPINADNGYANFHWISHSALGNGAAWAESAAGNVPYANVNASYRGTQPFINSAQANNWDGATPTFNYHPVTGINF